MAKTLTFTKEHGALDFKAVLDTVTMWLHTCANGKYSITMTKVQDKRSIQQNKLMWLWMRIIARAWSEATGKTFTEEDVHASYCLLFLPVNTPKGRVGGSTSSLTQEQMSEFLEKVKADAAQEYGIQLPTTDDYIHAAFAEYYS